MISDVIDHAGPGLYVVERRDGRLRIRGACAPMASASHRAAMFASYERARLDLMVEDGEVVMVEDGRLLARTCDAFVRAGGAA